MTEDFKAGVSKARNRVIARVFRELGLMEEWGSGYRRIVNSCRSGGYPEPEWVELGSVMRVAFYPHPEASEDMTDNVPINQRQQWFINQIQRNVKVSAKDIAGHWKVSEKTAKRDIIDLKQKSVIAFSGAAKKDI